MQVIYRFTKDANYSKFDEKTTTGLQLKLKLLLSLKALCEINSTHFGSAIKSLLFILIKSSSCIAFRRIWSCSKKHLSSLTSCFLLLYNIFASFLLYFSSRQRFYRGGSFRLLCTGQFFSNYCRIQKFCSQKLGKTQTFCLKSYER